MRRNAPIQGGAFGRWFEFSAVWTRTQSTRTAAGLPFEVALVETAELPAYQAIASKALQLRELGLSDRVIAARLGSSDKTVAKAIRWLGAIERRNRGAAPSPRSDGESK